jgi:CubicO group peptidase (beta-lactamase class C family)
MFNGSLFLLKYLSGFRNTILILLLLLNGNYHQALVKYERDNYPDTDFNMFFKPEITFSDDYRDYVEKEIDRLLHRRGFNGSVMLAHNGKAVYQKSMGFANVPEKIELREDDNIYQLASVGKQFTAMAVMILNERGLLEFDDFVCQHIPQFPYPDITIRHLLNHTSGLQNYMYLIDQYWKSENLPAQDDLLQIFLDRKLPLNFTPGRRFNYSNTGYAFLALVVQYVSDKSFADFVQDEIFTPLGMNHSFVFEPGKVINDEMGEYLVYGHERVGRNARIIPQDHLDGITGDKGIYSSLEDLLKWDNALNKNQLVSEETLQLAFEKGQLRSGYAINYGFGFRFRKEDSQEIAYHNGWWRGFKTSYVKLPDNTLIVILNNNNASINGLDRQISNIIKNSPYDVFPGEELLAKH